MRGIVKSINMSVRRGMRKEPVDRAFLRAGYGIEGDAHGGEASRQISLLAWEKIPAASLYLKPGDFAENITTEGIDLSGLKIGDILRIGSAEVRITKIGKECHAPCGIFRQLGTCIMPQKGIFAAVTKSGEVKRGDEIQSRHHNNK